MPDAFVFSRYQVRIVDGYGEFAKPRTFSPSDFPRVRYVFFPRFGSSRLGVTEQCSWQRFFHEMYPAASLYFSVPRPVDYEGTVLPSLDTPAVAGRRARLVAAMGRESYGYYVYGSLKAAARRIVEMMEQ